MTSPIIYYNRGGIRVTSDELVIHDKRYPLTELTGVGITRGYTKPYTTSCVAGACIFGTLATVGWQVSGLTSIVAAVLTVAFLIAMPISRRITRPAFELWADYHNNTIQLLWSRDEHTFNAIRFALCRARQARN
jgi:hypothetical protein